MAEPKLLKIKIDEKDFSELGGPNTPKSFDDIKNSDFGKTIKGKKKDDLNGYTRSVSRAQSAVEDALGILGGTLQNGIMEFSILYQEGVTNTYKFLGMDINSDYQAIIPFGDGYTIVGSMFQRDTLMHFIEDSSRFDDNVKRIAQDYIKSCSDKVFRKLTTAMKTGLIFDIYKDITATGNDSFEITDALKFVELIKDNIQYGDLDADEATDFNSVILNLMHNERKEIESISGHSSNDATNMTSCIISCLFEYWRNLIEEYKGVHRILSEIDLWSNLYKSCIGYEDFNRRMSKSIEISNSNGEIIPGNVSFSGVARNGDIMDADTFRDAAQSSLQNIESKLNGKNLSGVNAFFIQDLMLSMIDYEMFDNPYELTESEIQAISSYDSLRNVDSDAKICMESYNMDDPEERGMFMKSAIRSYERNFRDFKPKENYEVTEALSNMIENGERFKNRIVPDETFDGEDTSVYVVTSTKGELKIQIDKKSFMKVAKLSEKIMSSVLDMF